MNRLIRSLPLLMVLLAAGFLLSGCAGLSLKPKPDATRFYVLEPSLPPTHTVGDLTMGMERINLPEYLQDSRIVVRESAHEIRYAEHHRWSERLDRAVSRFLMGTIPTQSPVSRVKPAPWADPHHIDYILSLSIHRMEGHRDGTIRLDASWELRHPREGMVLHAEQFSHQESGWDGKQDYATLAAALSHAIEQLGHAIGEHLQSNLR